MSLSTREKVLSAATVFVIAFGLVGTQVRDRMTLITEKSRIAKELAGRISLQRELITSARDWADRYEQVKDQMPVFEPGQQVDTYWLNIMDIAAEQHDVRIRNRSAKDETVLSDVYEFPIEVREWEATLEAFLHFMHALISEGAMLDIRELRVSPVPNRQGILRGSFVLYCAYMRSASAPAPSAAPATASTLAAPATTSAPATPSSETPQEPAE